MNTWKAFYLFLKEARLLGSRWEKSGREKALSGNIKGREQIEVKDEQEYKRLMEYLSQSKRAVFSDFDGTITKAENDPVTRRTVVKKGFRRVHSQIINKLVQIRESGKVIAIATNRRFDKIKDYRDNILKRLKHPFMPEGAFELYWSGSMRGMDMESVREFEEFAFEFPEEEQVEIIEKLLSAGVLRSDETQHVEKIENKINIYVPKDVERNIFLKQISDAITEYLENGKSQSSLKKGYISVKVIDGGEDVISIVPAKADKVRARDFVQKRHGLKDSEILVLVDQPQSGGIDELVTMRGGITVGEENSDNPNLISTKKAIGLEGPKAALWVLEHTNFTPQRTIRRSFSATNL